MLANPVPGPPAAVLSAVLKTDPGNPPGPGGMRQARFSAGNWPALPSLVSEVVWLPEYALLDANGEWTGMVVSLGWATKGTVAVTAAYTPQPNDATILVNASGGAVTVTLPDATQEGYSPGQNYTIVKTDSSGNAVTVAATGGQLISGASTVTLSAASGFVSVRFDGVTGNNWWTWAANTPTGGPPTGAAGGALTGTYPNPGLATVTLAEGGTGQVTQQAAMDALAGATTSAQFLRGNGTHVQMAAITSGDLPAGTTGAKGALQLDGTASDIQLTGTAAAAGAVGKAADGGHIHPDPAWLPADAGWLGWAFDGALISGSFASVSGTIYLIRVNLRAAASVTNVILYIGTVGATLTASQSFAGLYAGTTAGAFTAGQQIGVTADQHTAWSTAGNANSYLTIALTGGPFSIPASMGFAWVAIVSNGTTPPTWGRNANQNSAASNTGLGVSSARFATNGTGTSLPSSITPASNVLLQPAVWAGVS